MIAFSLGRLLATAALVGLAACDVRSPGAGTVAAERLHAEPATLTRGQEAFRDHGCGACHRREGLPGARGITGPPLDDLAPRVYVAGHLPNTLDHLAMFIARPHDVDPDTAMPSTGLSLEDARAIALFLVHPP